jgi:5-methylcytosine-specific restriction endonuclease McrA
MDRRSSSAQEYRQRYGTSRWKRLRKAHRDKHPLCARCAERGVVCEATVVHHKVPHKGDPALFWDPDNLSSSCKSCHDIDEQRIERGGRARQDVGSDGWPM